MSPTISPSAHRADASATSRIGVAHVGCSGWHYASWRGIVYPETLPTTGWLHAYTQRFSTVELNNSFYRLPAPDTFAAWRAQVPSDFVFAVKASRFLTHIKRLRDPEEPLTRLLTHARPLGRTLGPILYQLPPRWVPDRDRLETFLGALPPRITPRAQSRLHHVIEMRDPRGYEPWVIDLLRQYDVALCVHDMPGLEAPLLAVGPIVYVRFHGYGAKYGGRYPIEVLNEWASWIRRALAGGKNVYAYFNNDMNGHAVQDAERLRALLIGASASRRPRAARAVPRPRGSTVALQREGDHR